MLIAGASLFLAGFTLGGRVATTPGTPASMEREFGPFWDVFDAIKNRYAGSPRPSDAQLIAAAIDGMLKSLNDPWSYYQQPQDFQASVQNVGGHQEGIGVVVQLQPRDGKTASCGNSDPIGPNCELAIVKPVPGSPADKAGIQPGDVIEAVDGKSLDGLTVDKVTPLIRGTQGTKVAVRIARGSRTVDFSIVRSIFDTPEVTTRILASGSVELIQVAAINNVAATQFHDALAAALAANRRSIVLDLRDNGGGYVDSAVKMASELLSSGVILYQKDASQNVLATNASSGGIATNPDIHVVVLTNGNTASAAEILAAALQSNHRAKLVGGKTYGKGVVQAWLPLDNDLGGFHLTIAQWLTPDKVWINHVGLQPDYPVSTDNVRAGTDPALDEALRVLGFPPTAAPGQTPAPSVAPTASPFPNTSPSPAASPS